MLDLAQPTPLTQIIADLDAKTPIGSVLRTAGWEAMPQGLRDQAFFAAGVTSAQFLAAQKQAVRDLISRAKGTNEKGQVYWKMDRSQFIQQMRQLGEALNVQRPGGRPDNMIREGDIADPLSIARLRLVINTQLEMAYGYADWLTGMDPDILDAFPAWELVRVSPRRVPRDWELRWAEAAVKVGWEGVYKAPGTERMIALKTSPIWVALSRFSKPHPPFDFNSGMGVEEIDRSEAEDMGLLDEDTGLIPALRPYQEGLEASIKGLGKEERRLIQETFGSQVATQGDTVHWTGERRRSGPRAVPPGLDVSQAFDLSPKVNPEMTAAFAVIRDSLSPILTPIRATAPLPVNGWVLPKHMFVFSKNDGSPVELVYGRNTGTPHLEAAHEVGHYWASQNLGRGQPEAGAPVDFTLTAQAWLREVMETEPVQMLTQQFKAATDPQEREALAYLLQPGELWARCFAEWAAVRSGNAAAMRELSQVINGQVPGQDASFYWGNAELTRLLPLLDALLLK